jgi:hypothetical protein
MSVVALTISLVGQVLLRDSFLSAATPAEPAPTLAELNQSIALAQQYIDGLYKQLPDGGAVQSETYGLPLKVHFANGDHWVLLGEGNAGACGGGCNASTSIVAEASTFDSESYQISFNSPQTPNALVVDATLKWRKAPASSTLTITPKKVTELVDVWLDNTNITSLVPGDGTLSATTYISNATELRSLRYTVRHATQEAYLYEQARGNSRKNASLGLFLQTNGFTPGYDMRAAMFGESKNLPDDLPLDTNAYPDCDHLPSSQINAYPYTSKACLGLEPYLDGGARDPFLQASQALQTLVKYGDPTHVYPQSGVMAAWMQGSSPQATSEQLQRQWSRTNFGIPTCTPVSCSKDASSVRTFTFGLLETILGYSHGDATARSYADAAAAVTMQAQIKADGLVRMANGTLYRPVQVGGFPVGWDDISGRFSPPNDTSLIGGVIVLTAGKMSMPPEYLGLDPSNSETTLDGWAFLTNYRCAKFAVGCNGVM